MNDDINMILLGFGAMAGIIFSAGFAVGVASDLIIYLFS